LSSFLRLESESQDRPPQFKWPTRFFVPKEKTLVRKLKMIGNGRTRQRDSIVVPLKGIERRSLKVLYPVQTNTINMFGQQEK